MLTEEYQKLVVKSPPPELKNNIQYGDAIEIDRKTTPVSDIDEIWQVLEEQCSKSLSAIRSMRNENPKAIYLYTLPHPDNPRFTIFGWKAWTDKKR